MQSFLISSLDDQKLQEFIETFLKKEGIDKFDVTKIISEKSIGISEIREFQKKIFLKPFRSLKKATILDIRNGITIESQNALLKSLEEPPQNTFILLISNSVRDLLPTIISRCKIIEFKKDKVLENKEVEKNLNLIKEIKDSNISKRLKIAQEIAQDKSKAINFLEEGILSLRSYLKENYDKDYLRTLKILQKKLRIVKSTNVNLRLVIEEFCLSI